MHEKATNERTADVRCQAICLSSDLGLTRPRFGGCAFADVVGIFRDMSGTYAANAEATYEYATAAAFKRGLSSVRA